jgi:hypothetical protein
MPSIEDGLIYSEKQGDAPPEVQTAETILINLLKENKTLKLQSPIFYRPHAIEGLPTLMIVGAKDELTKLTIETSENDHKDAVLILSITDVFQQRIVIHENAATYAMSCSVCESGQLKTPWVDTANSSGVEREQQSIDKASMIFIFFHDSLTDNTRTNDQSIGALNIV